MTLKNFFHRHHELFLHGWGHCWLMSLAVGRINCQTQCIALLLTVSNVSSDVVNLIKFDVFSPWDANTLQHLLHIAVLESAFLFEVLHFQQFAVFRMIATSQANFKLFPFHQSVNNIYSCSGSQCFFSCSFFVLMGNIGGRQIRFSVYGSNL